ncbi:hypothetical protein VSH64_48165 [Amycolatopsis rhabdoformis]|uniref:DUF8017 domain-containing protein n=1 Tax=Amycolatopsis rhabdoformis TaxID=1448059 RepID=A0ABZ1I821_9PSEU|nr:hypothetical protein [Amycolatopsis rhabdoformis]WSE30485.1 hypothetical protein VSH64_48165 [Amycolatopsis rhabdoformis]
MGLFGRGEQDSGTGGYEDNAALPGVGGYQPADASATPWSSAGMPEAGGYTDDPAGTGTGTGTAPRAEPKRIRPAGRPPSRLKGRPSRALWILVALMALGVALTNFFGAGRHHAASPGPVTPSRGPLTYQPEPRVVVPAVVAGWSSVASRGGVLAYDVPPTWTPEPGTVHGWDGTATSPGITLTTSASTGRGYCGSDSSHGGAGLTTEDLGDAEAAARKAVGDLIGSAYAAGAKVTYAPAQDATVHLETSTQPARVVLADVTQGGADACTQKHVTVGAIALAAPAQSVVLVAYTDDTTSRADLLRLLQSYRGVPAADRSTTTPPPTTR